MVQGAFVTANGLLARVIGGEPGNAAQIELRRGTETRTEDWPSGEAAIERIQSLCGIGSDDPRIAALRMALSFALGAR